MVWIWSSPHAPLKHILLFISAIKVWTFHVTHWMQSCMLHREWMVPLIFSFQSAVTSKEIFHFFIFMCCEKTEKCLFFSHSLHGGVFIKHFWTWLLVYDNISITFRSIQCFFFNKIRKIELVIQLKLIFCTTKIHLFEVIELAWTKKSNHPVWFLWLADWFFLFIWLYLFSNGCSIYEDKISTLHIKKLRIFLKLIVKYI